MQISSSNQSLSVFFDPQQGSYYKIDKLTGQTVRSHRNGTSFIKFKPQYTGSNYDLRKFNEKDLSPPSLLREPFKVHYDHKHTIPVQAHTLKRQTKSQANFQASGRQNMKPQSSLTGYQSRALQSRLIGSNEISEKLKMYSKIREQLRQQNHSPRKDLQGTISTIKISSEYNNQIKRIGGEKILKKVNGNFKQKNKTIETSSDIVLKSQYLKERQIFFRFNPNLKPQENERHEKQLKQRKTNLKILENLFISKNDRQTSTAYK